MKPEILREIRTLITPPEAWTINACARDVNGDQVDADDPDAVRWCVMGAIERVVGDGPVADDIMKALSARVRAMPGCSTEGGTVLVDFNDTQGHAAVLALLDAELAELEGTHGA